jgi:lipopolysaccharide export system permease protein
MFKIYQKYLIKKFLRKFSKITLIFFSISIILGMLEEINFFKDMDINFHYPYFLTLLNVPITLFEIFPFIFLLTTQFLFFDIFKNDELSLLKTNGLTNLKIIKILFFLAILIGIINIVIYYNIASTLKFHYSNIKNNLSNDNKYLAVANNSGLWIKDEIENKKIIIKAEKIENQFLLEAVINEFDSKFDLIRTIKSKRIDINKFDWIIYNPYISIDNITKNDYEKINYLTSFNSQKINSLFSNVSTLSLNKLFEVKKDYEKLGYSSDEIKLHLLKLGTTPIFYGLITLFSAIVMFSFPKNMSLLFYAIIGILISVIIYYMNYMFISLGISGRIPISLSIFFPFFLISILSIIGLININEK